MRRKNLTRGFIGALPALLILAINFAAPQIACADFVDITSNYVFTAIDGVPTGINNSGQIVGAGSTGIFLRQANGAMEPLNIPGAMVGSFNYTVVMGWPQVGLGINNLGQIVGNTSSGAFIRNADGTVTTVSLPGPGIATGINDAQQIVGTFFTSDFTVCGSNVCGFIRDSIGNVTTFAAFVETWTTGVNNAGQVVGYTQNIESAFVRDADGTLHFFGPSGLTFLGGATGINNLGQIVGNYSLNAGAYQNGHGLLYSAWGSAPGRIDFPGASATFLTGINDSGQIVGEYISADRTQHGFLATPVPEPSTIALAITGLMSCVGVGRRYWCGRKSAD